MSMTNATTQATTVSLTNDDRLRPVTYEAESDAKTNDIQNKSYSYNNDGSIRQTTNNIDPAYSQTYDYDFARRW